VPPRDQRPRRGQDRPEQLFAGQFGFLVAGGQDRRSHQRAGGVRRAATVDDDLRALADRSIDGSRYAVAGVGADHRRADDSLLGAVTGRQVRGGFSERRTDAIAARLVPDDDGNRAGQAALPGVAECRLHHRRDREVQIGVGIDNHGVLGAAQRLDALS
jgi:hypothetical protein